MSDTYLVFFSFFLASAFQQIHDRNVHLRRRQAATAPTTTTTMQESATTTPLPSSSTSSISSQTSNPSPITSFTQSAKTINMFATMMVHNNMKKSRHKKISHVNFIAVNFFFIPIVFFNLFSLLFSSCLISF
jgi:hypothetical protein